MVQWFFTNVYWVKLTQHFVCAINFHPVISSLNDCLHSSFMSQNRLKYLWCTLFILPLDDIRWLKKKRKKKESQSFYINFLCPDLKKYDIYLLSMLAVAIRRFSLFRFPLLALSITEETLTQLARGDGEREQMKIKKPSKFCRNTTAK